MPKIFPIIALLATLVYLAHKLVQFFEQVTWIPRDIFACQFIWRMCILLM